MSVKVGRDGFFINGLLVLYLLDRSSGKIGGITKLQKMAFLAENDIEKSGLHGFCCEFFKHNYGPMSREIYNSYHMLVENGLIDEPGLRLTGQGERIIEDFEYFFALNRSVFEHIDSIVESYSKYRLSVLKGLVYHMKVPIAGQEYFINDLPHGTKILGNVDLSSFSFDEGDIETFNIYLDKELFEKLEKSFDDARRGKACTLEEIFS